MTLEVRKRQLLCESELNRKVLHLELGQWQLRGSRWEARASTAQRCLSIAGTLGVILLPRKYSWLFRLGRALASFRKWS